MPRVEIPDRLYRQLETQARQTGLSVNEQAARVLADALAAGEQHEAALLEDIRAERKSLSGLRITEAELQQAKRSGRE